MSAPAAPPPSPPPSPSSAPSPAKPGISRTAIIITTSIGGGVLAASLFLSNALPPGGPLMAIVSLGFAGALALFVGSILGAISDQFSTSARAGFAAGAAIAFLLAFFVLIMGPAEATQTTPVCGAIVAGPGLLALRSFTLLRDSV